MPRLPADLPQRPQFAPYGREVSWPYATGHTIYVRQVSHNMVNVDVHWRNPGMRDMRTGRLEFQVASPHQWGELLQAQFARERAETERREREAERRAEARRIVENARRVAEYDLYRRNRRNVAFKVSEANRDHRRNRRGRRSGSPIPTPPPYVPPPRADTPVIPVFPRFTPTVPTSPSPLSPLPGPVQPSFALGHTIDINAGNNVEALATSTTAVSSSEEVDGFVLVDSPEQGGDPTHPLPPRNSPVQIFIEDNGDVVIPPVQLTVNPRYLQLAYPSLTSSGIEERLRAPSPGTPSWGISPFSTVTELPTSDTKEIAPFRITSRTIQNGLPAYKGKDKEGVRLFAYLWKRLRQSINKFKQEPRCSYVQGVDTPVKDRGLSSSYALGIVNAKDWHPNYKMDIAMNTAGMKEIVLDGICDHAIKMLTNGEIETTDRALRIAAAARIYHVIRNDLVHTIGNNEIPLNVRDFHYTLEVMLDKDEMSDKQLACSSWTGGIETPPLPRGRHRTKRKRKRRSRRRKRKLSCPSTTTTITLTKLLTLSKSSSSKISSNSLRVYYIKYRDACFFLLLVHYDHFSSSK